jgi:hypothetical protein
VHTETETDTAVSEPGATRGFIANRLGRRARRGLVHVAARGSRVRPVGRLVRVALPSRPPGEATSATGAAGAPVDGSAATATPADSAVRGLSEQSARIQGYLAERFRLPTPDDDAPEQRRLIGVCAWAGLLAIGGLPIVLRVLLALFQVNSDWYAVQASGIGLLGVLFTVAAFSSVHRRVLPWTMLGCATATLAGAIAITTIE